MRLALQNLLFFICCISSSHGVVPEVSIDGPSEQFPAVGNNIQLTCRYNSSPAASEVLWEKNGIIISRDATMENGTRGAGSAITHFNEGIVQLTINASISQDAGDYTCLVINTVGNSSDTTAIQVRPDPPENVSIVSRTSRAVNVSWIPGFDGNSEILNYTVTISEDNQNFRDAKCQRLSSSACVVASSSTSAFLEDLHPGRKYYLKVFASNKVGQSAASLVVNTTTDEEAPSAPPVNVRGHNTSSTSILVQWGEVPADDQNGIILSYTVTYKALPNGIQLTKNVTHPTTQATLTDLNEYTNYSISVFASTAKGAGNVSAAIIVITDLDKPNAPPTDVRGRNASSTSILVQWGAVPADDQNGIILSYTVTYRALPDGIQLTKNVTVPVTNATFTNLNKYTNYSITVFASTAKGAGNVSAPIIVITDQDKPDGTPQNVSGHNSSSTSILVTWNEVPVEHRNGIITGYTIVYKSQTENHNRKVRVGANDRQKNITGLKEYVFYNITVLASTVKGDGPESTPIVDRTDEDKPSDAPQNVSGRNSSSTSILVKWNEVPVEERNGIITNYTIVYKSQTENDNGNVSVGANERQKNITELKEYVLYNITVFASTVKGDGPESTPIVVRTDEDKPSASPLNLRPCDTTSTSIVVRWDEVPSDDKNGIIIWYKVRCQAVGGISVNAIVYNYLYKATTMEAHLRYLTANQRYNIKVLASTIKGDGPYSIGINVTTNQSKPGAPPNNVRGHNTSSTRIKVEWDEVPEDKKHGEIQNYTVIYWKVEGGIEQNAVEKVTSKRDLELRSLTKYRDYNIRVLASTIKGRGPASTSVIVRTDQDVPSEAPEITSVEALNSTSVLMKWQGVAEDQRNGIITHYTIHYEDTRDKKNGSKEVQAPALTVTINGLRQQAEYTFSILAATSKGDGPLSASKTEKTKSIPTVESPGENNIGTSEAKVPFNNKETLSSGKPVSYFQMIVTRLKEGQDPGNSADPAYESVTRNYETKKDGEPYITAEFSRGAVETEFPVGDEKYYSRNGVTDSKRKRRDTTDIIKYRNGKLDDNTKYAVFQRSFASDGEYENEGFIEFTTNKDNTALIVTGVLVPLLIVAVIAVIILIYRRRSVFGLHIGMVTLRNQQIERNLKNPLLTHGSRVRTARDIQHLDASEIPPIRTECFEELGQGAFGKVKKAKLKDGLQYFVEAQDWANLKREEKIVAVKQLHENANDEQRKEFLDEIELMKEVGKHPNVLSFLGCWTTTKPLQLVIEYIPHGDLLHWLRSKRSQLRGSTMGAGLVGPKDTEFYAGTREQKTTSDKDSEADQTKTNKCIVEIPMIAFSSSNQEGDPPAQKNDDECDEDCDSFDSSDLLKFAWQIARGMSYLSEKGLVHRDLAARNILMGHSKRLKIGDFGLMRQLYREVYKGKKQKKLPIKWMAPEAIFDEIFSVKSDVWSYGVVMWEIGTLGGSPYPLLNHTQMLRRLKRGYRMEKPDICSDTFYTLMRDCWNQIPDERPSFENLVERVEHMLLQEVEYVDISKLDESEDYYKVQESATAETESESEPEQETGF